MVLVNSVVVTDDLIKAMLQRDLVSDIPAHVIADAGADDVVPAVDVLAQLQRLQVKAAIAFTREVTEQLEDLDALVADHLVAFGVPQHRHLGPALKPAAP
jgi:hypothetical protein